MMPYKIQFAPLQGYTDAIYRNTYDTHFGGVDTYYTPFLRLEKDLSYRNKDVHDIDPNRNTVKELVPQILPKDVEETERLIELIIRHGYKKLDINMGCPFPMVAKSGRGSGLLVQPEKIHEILCKAFSYSDIRISVKLRLGYSEPDELLGLLPVLEQFPLAQLAVHARTMKQQYRGECHVDHFEQIYATTKLPLIYNGDITTITEYRQIVERFPAIAGVMMGRGLLMNPFLAAECKGYSIDNRHEKLHQFLDRLSEQYSEKLCGEAQVLSKLKSIWDYLLPDLPKKQRKAILKSGTLRDYDRAIDEAIDTIT